MIAGATCKWTCQTFGAAGRAGYVDLQSARPIDSCHPTEVMLATTSVWIAIERQRQARFVAMYAVLLPYDTLVI